MAMQISEKYGLVYVITKLGLLFVYDLADRDRRLPQPHLARPHLPHRLLALHGRLLRHQQARAPRPRLPRHGAGRACLPAQQTLASCACLVSCRTCYGDKMTLAW